MKTLSEQKVSWIPLSLYCLLLITFAAQNGAAQNTFPANGNAGVGTTDPQTALQVIANSARPSISVRNTGDGGFSGVEYERLGTNGVPSVTAYVGLDQRTGNNFFRVNSLNNFPLVFLTENVERMRITSTGRVGIGTLTPLRTLDVGGDINTSARYQIDRVTVLSTAGTGNLFVGERVAEENSGEDNSFFGRAAANANTRGSGNSFFGRSAGNLNTEGNRNAFFGAIAGNRNLRGDENSFFGFRAGAASRASQNSFFGAKAGEANESGANNAYFGWRTGLLSMSSNNSFFGSEAGVANIVGADNSFFGRSAGGGNQGGRSNSFFGKSAGDTNRAGNSNTIIGANADMASDSLNFATAIGADAVVSSSNTVVLGRVLDNVIVPGSLKIGVMPNSSGGDVHLCRDNSNQVTLCFAFSSLRYKRDVNSLNGALNLVRQLRPISFRWKIDGTPDVCLVAEEVDKVAPLLVTRNSEGEIQGVKYDKLSAVLVNAIQEQQVQLQARDARIADLEARLAALERTVVSTGSSVPQQRKSKATSVQVSNAKRNHARR